MEAFESIFMVISELDQQLSFAEVQWHPQSDGHYYDGPEPTWLRASGFHENLAYQLTSNRLLFTYTYDFFLWLLYHYILPSF